MVTSEFCELIRVEKEDFKMLFKVCHSLLSLCLLNVLELLFFIMEIQFSWQKSKNTSLKHC